jgi:acyl dehydratase
LRISSDIVGREVGPDEQILDERWLMAYSAALGKVELEPHPLFPVCYEWPATRLLRERAGLVPLDARLVHAQHDLRLHAKPRPGRVRVAGKVVAVAQKKPGVLVVFRFAAHDERGLVSTTDFSALYRDVKLDGAERNVAAVEDPPRHDAALERIGEVAVAATAAHIYTECARIWNPIHTDRAYARAAGLPDIILHGTATLALSVSKLVDVLKPEVRRVRCRFAGMVLMPSTLTVHASRQGDGIAFATRDARGETVIDRGWIS